MQVQVVPGNFITTRVAQVTGKRTATQLVGYPAQAVAVSTTYFDGLGRPSQKVTQAGSPTQYDLVEPITYDAIGRTSSTYLPYAQDINNGEFKVDAVSKQAAFYAASTTGDNIANDSQPYTRTVYEASPLDRVLKQGAVGSAWRPTPGPDHTLKPVTRTNWANEVRRFDCTATSVSSPGFYAAGELFVSEMWDEHDALITEYKDKDGLVVLKRVSTSSGTVCKVRGYYEGVTTANPISLLTLDAPTDTRLTGIQSATFGVGSGTTGTCGSFTFGSCVADVTAQVQQKVATSLTANTTSLTIPINVDYLGDPCPGSGKTLQVVATYTALSTSTTKPDQQTYYAYDSFNRLRLVIQPQGTLDLPTTGTWTPSPDFQSRWCFRYVYDAKGRVIEKQVPGSGPVRIAYNQRDLPVLTQDANQGTTNWTFTKYDGLNRPILTGTVSLGKDHTTVQSELNAASETVFTEQRTTTTVGYTLTNSYPRINITESSLLSITYYDDYTYPSLNATSQGDTTLSFVGSAATRAVAVRGQVTGTRVRQLPDHTTTYGGWLTSVLYYDSEYRLLQSVTKNTLSGTDRTTNGYDFVGRVQYTMLKHLGNGVRRTIRNDFVYDHAGRLLTTTQRTDGQPSILLAKQEYNALGQLVDKKLHSADGGATFLQSVDYRYNIRGWLTNINNRNLSNDGSRYNDADPNVDNVATEGQDLFGVELMYDKEQNLKQSPLQYNGNISEVMWSTRSTANNSKLRGYAYSYDQTNRLTEGIYRTYEGTGWNNINMDFSVSGITYDLNGNLKTMIRNGQINNPTSTSQTGILDQLTYSYKTTGGSASNRLLAVDDLATATTLNVTAATHDFEDRGNLFSGQAGNNTPEYTYDAAGNLVADKNKGITLIRYNRLNLPCWIEFGAGNRIEYVYSATGTKLRKRVYKLGESLPTQTDYVGAFVYEGNSQISQPVFAHTAEGRVLYFADRTSYKWKYEYHLKDHLGNLRMTFRDTDGPSTEKQLTAGMEPVNAAEEEQRFAHVSETRLRDAMHARTGSYVARLNAREGRRLGPSITLAVAAGDSLKAEVYGRYDRNGATGSLLRSGALVAGAAVAGNPSDLSSDRMQRIHARRRWLPYVGASVALLPQLLKSRSAELPTAFLRYELFDQDSQLVASGTRSLLRTATDTWQRLDLGLKADSAGYVKVSVINESAIPAYFDDLALQPAEPLYFQENHYDPWGLNLVGIETVGIPNAKFQYNGKEKQEEFGLNWNDYGARMYDSQLGRWHAVDPLAEKYYSWTSYNMSINNPILYKDIDGRDIINTQNYLRFTGSDAQTLFNSLTTRPPNKIHLVPESETPAIYQHTLDAFKKGRPQILTYDSDKNNRDKRREDALKASGLPSRYPEGLERDEYPYASTMEGGKNALVAYVPKKQNGSQGARLKQLYSQMKTGDKFIVLPLPDSNKPPVPVPQPFIIPVIPVQPTIIDRLVPALRTIPLFWMPIFFPITPNQESLPES
ncbi:DUF6443 domain-containing protein [Hymenobacter guriensis]|uniref:DUF6443 domain-containing protein n=1 Tax=Hymenobacter guriensis TaxID=2793065 RepID=UPI00293D83A1|nr:DUF6443 domain-containing protein [Hymenobacter guriensis]